jgi:hypothetical protein
LQLLLQLRRPPARRTDISGIGNATADAVRTISQKSGSVLQ